MNYKLSFLLVMLIVAANPMQAQNLIIGTTGNVGLSKVTSNHTIPGDFREKFALSGNLGMFLEKKIGQKSSLGVEALWVQIKGNEGTRDKIIRGFNGQNIENIGIISEKSKLHLSYLGIPVFYRHKIWKFGIKVGMQPMIFMFASSTYQATGTISNEPIKSKGKTKNLKFDRFDLGPKIGIDYNLSERLRLRADYYHGLMDITADEFPWFRKNRQISLGVQYNFENRKLKK